MGSFASSLHVKCSNEVEFVDAVNNLLANEGYRPTDEEFDESALWGFGSAIRAIRICRSGNDWMSLLDTDLMSTMSLAHDLSQKFKTYAINVMVNDSDSWHYRLLHQGTVIDEFDSSGAMSGDMEFEDSFDDSLPPLSEMSPGFSSQIDQLKVDMGMEMLHNMPAEIQAIRDRIERGTASQDDLLQYGEYAKSLVQKFMGSVDDVFENKFSIPEDESTFREKQAVHFNAVRPLLSSETAEEDVLNVLSKKSIFAEHNLAEFMPMIGINPLFASLNYRYYEELTGDQLSEQGITLIAQLKVKSSEPHR
ncbi:MAG: hypothetical protein WEB58_02755 [Planctomycetaceae bacterium]